MGKKPFRLSMLHALLFILSFNIFSMNVSMAQKAPIPIKVGVVLDMDDYVGQMGSICISMALSEFYATHAHYKTRLVLVERDSKGDIVGAAAAALDLLKNVEVQAIIGPVYSMQANFMINLGQKAHVPIITFSATSPSLSSIRSPYFIRATLKDSSQVQSITAIVQAFGWREAVPIYMDNEFGEGIIPFLTDALQQVNVRVPYRSIIPSSPEDSEIVAELYKLMTMQTRVFIVHMDIRLAARLFTKAKEVGMMSEGYAWIITDSITNELNSVDSSVIESMLGVIGVRPHVPKTEELNNFTVRYKKRLQLDGLTSSGVDLNIFGLWAYDSAIALAMAAEEARLKTSTYTKANISINSTDLEAFGVSSTGTKLIQALSRTVFIGIAGNFKLVNGQLQVPPYQIVNVVGHGTRVVGYWTKENEIVRELNSRTPGTAAHLTSTSNFGSIIWPGDNKSPPKGWTIEKLYDQLFFINKQEYDAAVGDVTIIANRSLYVDFTMPYAVSGVSMVVPIKDGPSKNAWAFLKPLTWELWLTSFCSFIFIGFLVWILEHRINEDFRGPFWRQVGMIFWFAFSTIVFAHKERVISNLARFVLVIWFLVVLVLTSSYTASLTSMLTVQQLKPSITDVSELIRKNEYVGYQKDSFVRGLLKSMNFKESRLLPFNSTEGILELFSKGNGNGGVAAVFDEIPYLKAFLTRYGSKYIMVDPTYKTDGFGFVFPRGSPLVPDISRAILNVTESESMMSSEKSYFEAVIGPMNSSTIASSNSLGLESFWGLFLIVWIAAFSAFMIYVIMFLRENWHVIEQSDNDSTIWSKTTELLRRFNDRDLNSHSFKSKCREKDNSCRDCCTKRATEFSTEHFEPSPSTFPTASPHTNGPPSPTLSSPEELNKFFLAEQVSSSENGYGMLQGETSHVIKQDTELVNPNPNQKLSSTLADSTNEIH